MNGEKKMKSIILASTFLIAVSAQAMETEKSVDSTTGDTSTLINRPTHFGSHRPFSAYLNPSSENGVCKALGHEKAAAGSLRSSDSKANSIKVDANGSVVGGPYDYFVNQIVCLNKASALPNEKSVQIINPTHPDSGLGYSAYLHPSSEDGICVASGYQRAATGSLRSADSRANTIQVDSNGSVIGGPYDYYATLIICVTGR